ncbi:MAG TPA: CAP domain-containing protein [Candidatus Dormibacteraeota bacterium]|nr:CAP domain-containing protein [Candidatus Dormibacteraeota bacterium]
MPGDREAVGSLASPWRRPARIALIAGLTGALVAGYTVRPQLVQAGDPGTAGQLFSLTNQDRTSNGLGALASNGNLNSIATSAGGNCGGTAISGRSADMINRQYFSHQIPPCGGYVWNVFSLGAYSSAGENIGWNNYPPGQSVSQINTAFMNSPDHRANIMGNYNQLGTGAWAASGSWMGNNGVIMYTEIFINGPGGGGGGGGAPPPPRPPRPTGGGGGGGSAPAPAADTAPPPAAPSPSPKTCPVPVEIGEADRNSPAPSLAPDGGQPPCPSPNLNGAGTSPSPAGGAQGVTNEVQGADREATPRGLLETVVDQVLRLFLNV